MSESKVVSRRYKDDSIVINNPDTDEPGVFFVRVIDGVGGGDASIHLEEDELVTLFDQLGFLLTQKPIPTFAEELDALGTGAVLRYIPDGPKSDAVKLPSGLWYSSTTGYNVPSSAWSIAREKYEIVSEGVK